MCRCTPHLRTPFCGKPGCEMPPQAVAYEAAQRVAESERAAFIAAITKLADDADFRRSFLDHCNRWLNPMTVVTRIVDDVDPASRPPRTEVWCPDRDTQPIEGIEIAPRPVMKMKPNDIPWFGYDTYDAVARH